MMATTKADAMSTPLEARPKLTPRPGPTPPESFFRSASGLLGLLCLLLGGGAALPARADYSSTLLSQGPVGYWRLDETTPPPPELPAANEGTLGTNADATYFNFPVRGIEGPFAGSAGLDLNGVNQFIAAHYSTNLNPSAFTIEAWLRPGTATPEGNLTCVMSSIHSDDPRSGWLIYQSGGPGDTDAPGWQLRLYNEQGLDTSLRLLVTNAVTPGVWHHVVFAFDGTNASGYLNGQFQSAARVADSGGWVPNRDAPLTVGLRSEGNFPWEGAVAEVAYYGGALTDSRVRSHFDAATTNSIGYATAVKQDAPLVYYRFREQPDVRSANLGSLGGAASALYIHPAQPGQPGPALPGFLAGNRAVNFDGGAGTVAIPGLNLNTNTVTLTAWVQARGGQAGQASILLCDSGTTLSGLIIDIAGGLGLAYNWAGDNAALNWKSELSLVDSEWCFVALVVQPDQGVLHTAAGAGVSTFASATNLIHHAVQAFDGATLLGTDADLTNTFRGLIDEVAIFNRALSPGEIYSQYAAAVGEVGPRIFADPQAPGGLYEEDAVALKVDAGGAPLPTYQWRRNGVELAGETNSTLIRSSLLVSDAGSYDVVVANSAGSVTSQPTELAVNPIATPSISGQPSGRAVYPGGTFKLGVTAAGGGLRYQWLRDGSPVSGATNSSHQVASAAISDAGVYSVSVSNRLGVATSAAATITVIPAPAGTFEAVMVADAPEAWWRLNEDSTAVGMLDAMGRHDGTYQAEAGVTPNVPGAILGSADKAVSFDGSQAYGQAPYASALNSREFTLEGWVKTTVLDDEEMCPLSTRYSKRGAWFWSYPAGHWSAGVSQGGDDFYVPSEAAAAGMRSDTWTHLAMTYDETQGFNFYINGQWDGQTFADFDRNAAGPLLIGARGVSAGTSADMFFKGQVDEVAVFTRALPWERVHTHYAMGRYSTNTPPLFLSQPKPVTVSAGDVVVLDAQVEGSEPLAFQWFKDDAPITGATDAVLVLPSASFADTAGYQLRAANTVGTNSSVVTAITVLPPVQFVNATNDLVLHLKFDADLTDASGRNNSGANVGSATFVAGIIGSHALRYETDSENSVYRYVTLGTPADLLFGTDRSFSVAYWARLVPGQLSGDLPFLCSATNSYGSFGMTFAPSYQSGGWSWSLADETSSYGLYGRDFSLDDGAWHHLAHTFDRVAKVGITYLDGVEVNVTSIDGLGSFDAPGPFNIGQDASGAYAETGGADLDDLGVWRRVLAPAEVYSMHYAGVSFGASFDTYGPVSLGLSYSEKGLLLVWQAGTLLEADKVDGPWTPVAGAAAPSYRVAPAADNKFYRVRL
jgi:hypothetical protein